MSKCKKVLFTLSVLLNVLLIGALGGVVAKDWDKKPWHMAKDMSPESRDMMKANFKKMREDMKPLFTDMRRNREELRTVLQQEHFDAARFDQVSARLRSLRQQMGERMSVMTKEMVAVLPAQDRQKMADHFVMGFGKRGMHGGGWKCDDKDEAPEHKVEAPPAD